MESAAIESGNQALKALFLLNGGACIALLGFLASTLNSSKPEIAHLMQNIVSALQWFAYGVGAATLASCLAYVTNSTYANALLVQEDTEAKSIWKKAVIWHRITVGAASAALTMFAVGVASVSGLYTRSGTSSIKEAHPVSKAPNDHQPPGRTLPHWINL